VNNYTLTDNEKLMLIAGLNEIAAHALDNGDDDRGSDIENLRRQIASAHTVRLIGVSNE